MTSEAMTIQGTKALATFDYGDDANQGFEGQTAADTAIPFIILLQPLSPTVLEGKASPDGTKAAAGMWYHTITEQLYPGDKGFLFVPATTKHNFGEWVPRDDGGGYRGSHDPTSEIVLAAMKESTAFGEYKAPNGNDLVEAFNVFGVVCNEDGTPDSAAVISFTSAKIKSYRNWMTRLRQLRVGNSTPPMFANLARLTSELKKFDDGQAFVPVIQAAIGGNMKASLLPPDDDRFIMAKACRDMVNAGTAKVDYAKQHDAGGASKDELPF